MTGKSSDIRPGSEAPSRATNSPALGRRIYKGRRQAALFYLMDFFMIFRNSSGFIPGSRILSKITTPSADGCG
jgi:hypothetical protein